MKKENRLHFWRYFSASHNQAHPNLSQQKQKLFNLWHNRVNNPLVDTVNQKFNYFLNLYISSKQ